MGIYITGPAVGGVVSLTLTHSWLLPHFDQQWRDLLALWAAVAALSGVGWWLLASLPGIRTLADERRAADHTPHGQLLLSLLKQPAVRLLLAMAVGVFLISHGLTNWLPALLVHGGMDAITAGYWSAIPTVIGILGSLCIPRLAIPSRRFRILVVLCAAMLCASLLLQFQTHVVLLPGLILQGIARSTLTTVLVLILVELPHVGARHAGIASGLFFGAAEIGGMLGPLVLGVLYDFTHGFAAGLALFTLIGIALVASVRRLRDLA
jgi:cyanate permease